jgi:hypothetical protein
MTDTPIGKPIYALLASCLVVAAACASPAQKPGDKPPPLKGSDCVFFSALYDWQELDQNNLVIWAPGRRDAYHIYLTVPLYDLKFSAALAFIDKDHDGQLCGFSRDEIAITDRSFPQRSSITAMKRLDAAGIAKLEEQFKTKLTSDSKKQKPKDPERETAQ